MRRTLIVALLLIAAPALAAPDHARVVDGDTIEVHGERIRLLGLDAAELRARCPAERDLALAARDRLAALLADGAEVRPHGRDRWGRTLAVVRDASGADVAGILIAEGLARPYHGAARQPWCTP
jgi:micrococcal nuclease